MSKTITIPTGISPLEVSINDVKYVFTPGLTVTVPDEVAELLRNNLANAPVESNQPEDMFPKVAVFELGDSTGELKTDAPYLSTLVVWRKGKLVYAKLGEKIYLPVELTDDRTMIFANRSIDPDKQQLIDNTIYWPAWGNPSFSQNIWGLAPTEDDSGSK